MSTSLPGTRSTGGTAKLALGPVHVTIKDETPRMTGRRTLARVSRTGTRVVLKDAQASSVSLNKRHKYQECLAGRRGPEYAASIPKRIKQHAQRLLFATALSTAIPRLFPEWRSYQWARFGTRMTLRIVFEGKLCCSTGSRRKAGPQSPFSRRLSARTALHCLLRNLSSIAL